MGFEVYKSVQENKPEDPRQYFNLDIESIYSAELEVGLKKIELKKTNKGWWIKSPIKEKADSMVIQEWLSLITDSEIQEIKIESKIDWSKFGLDDFMGRIFIYSQKNPKVGIYVSSLKSFDQRLYLRIEQEGAPPQLLVASLSWKDLLLKSANAFRDQKLFSGISNRDFGSIHFLEIHIRKSFPKVSQGRYTLQAQSSVTGLEKDSSAKNFSSENSSAKNSSAIEKEGTIKKWVFKIQGQDPQSVEEKKVKDFYVSLMDHRIQGFPSEILVQKISRTPPVAKVILNQMSFLFYYTKTNPDLESQFLVHNLKFDRWVSLSKRRSFRIVSSMAD